MFDIYAKLGMSSLALLLVREECILDFTSHVTSNDCLLRFHEVISYSFPHSNFGPNSLIHNHEGGLEDGITASNL